MKKDIDLTVIASEIINFLSSKDTTVQEAKVIIGKIPDMIDAETKLKNIG